MGLRIILCVIGMFFGAALVGISINDKVTQSWQTFTGQKVMAG